MTVAWAFTKKGILIIFIIKFNIILFPLTEICISHIFMGPFLLD